jgi:hypothetical protein
MARVTAVCMDVMDRPWQWGAADCCTAACDVFAVLHGVDPMAPLRGRYSSRKGALRQVARHGGWHAMAEELAARAGLVPSDGQPGDIALIMTGDTPALGICIEGRVFAGKSQMGMATVPDCVRCWRAA